VSKECLFTYVTDWTFAIDPVSVLDSCARTHTHPPTNVTGSA